MDRKYKVNRRLLSYEEKLERVTFYNEAPDFLSDNGIIKMPYLYGSF